MKCYNKKCLYNIRKDEECGFKQSQYDQLYITAEGKCGQQENEE